MANLENSRALFEKRVNESEQIVSSVEALWQTAPAGSHIRRQINESQLAALYEMAFISLFGYWENFIEDCTVRMLAGQGTSSYSPSIRVPPRERSLLTSRSRVLGGRAFLLWYDPVKAANRVAGHVVGSPLESVLRGSSTHIERMASIRHAIAHRSEDAIASFRVTSLALVGIEYAKPGDLLRSQDHSDPLNPTRWLRRLTTDLRQFAVVATS